MPSSIDLVAATPNRRVRAAFAWYAERLLRRRFAAVRAARGSRDLLSSWNEADGPALLLMSHSAWWDPIIGSLLWRRYLQDREPYAPMDLTELARFRFMRKLGMFGIAPDEPASREAMVGYLQEIARHTQQQGKRLVVLMTPEGRFNDPRSPRVVRPGAAALASRLGIRSVMAVAIEYAFWNEQRPEVFLRAEVVPAPDALTTTGWLRTMQRTMESNRNALAERVIARDGQAFEDLLAPRGSVHPVYDLWLRLRGRSASIDTTHRGMEATR
ncbi:MAG: lysophospholipid acyltransferase family protein [Phycisphaerae bacterium]|jgi:1-acyl-sn-glycerol-3-phosphate acyltransferase|nr:lysophospholipid acyltransferase family protein [Phycisphaerae bacterium]